MKKDYPWCPLCCPCDCLPLSAPDLPRAGESDSHALALAPGHSSLCPSWVLQQNGKHGQPPDGCALVSCQNWFVISCSLYEIEYPFFPGCALPNSLFISQATQNKVQIASLRDFLLRPLSWGLSHILHSRLIFLLDPPWPWMTVLMMERDGLQSCSSYSHMVRAGAGQELKGQQSYCLGGPWVTYSRDKILFA